MPYFLNMVPPERLQQKVMVIRWLKVVAFAVFYAPLVISMCVFAYSLPIPNLAKQILGYLALASPFLLAAFVPCVRKHLVQVPRKCKSSSPNEG